jgi:hypothetical protein
MPVVTMKGQTIHRVNDVLHRLWPGMNVKVDDATAERWVDIGLAEPAKGKNAAPTPPHEAERFAERNPVRQEVFRTDLRIAANHGDVQAARRLIDLGEDADAAPAVEGTPPPLELTDERAPGDDQEEEVEGGDDDADEKPKAAAPRRQTTGASARRALSR